MQDREEERRRYEERKRRRRALRKSLTPAEARLWKLLQKSQLEGRKFRRQHSAGPYILDFFCPEEKLAVELDGEAHNNLVRWEYDEERTMALQRYGIRVIRFENREVFENPEGVLLAMVSHFKDRPGTTGNTEED